MYVHQRFSSETGRVWTFSFWFRGFKRTTQTTPGSASGPEGWPILSNLILKAHKLQAYAVTNIFAPYAKICECCYKPYIFKLMLFACRNPPNFNWFENLLCYQGSLRFILKWLIYLRFIKVTFLNTSLCTPASLMSQPCWQTWSKHGAVHLLFWYQCPLVCCI